MKNYILILFAFILFSCEKGNISTVITDKGGQVMTERGPFKTIRMLDEFEYKEHTYISIDLNDGFSLTHAGDIKNIY